MQPTEESSSNFFPVDLTSNKQSLKLIPGAILEKEKLILGDGMYSGDEYRLKRAQSHSSNCMEFKIPLIIK